jgi:cob(I)alamin adenosyltransferase
MKIYTKTGDKGYTCLFGGTMVPKNDYRIEAYGTIDELISWLGLLRSQELDQHDKDIILKIQDRLMLVSSHLSDEKRSLQNLPILNENDVEWLENEIDTIDNRLPALNSFIIPGGNQTIAYCHITRNVCRRAERRLVPVINERKELGIAMKFLNRLSDYLFMLCRKIGKENNIDEITWSPKL